MELSGNLASRKFIEGGVGKWELPRKCFMHMEGMLKIVAKPKLESSLQKMGSKTVFSIWFPMKTYCPNFNVKEKMMLSVM